MVSDARCNALRWSCRSKPREGKISRRVHARPPVDGLSRARTLRQPYTAVKTDKPIDRPPMLARANIQTTGHAADRGRLAAPPAQGKPHRVGRSEAGSALT
jgi:hypothetical protein